jgi:hypothetical protein
VSAVAEEMTHFEDTNPCVWRLASRGWFVYHWGNGIMSGGTALNVTVLACSLTCKFWAGCSMELTTPVCGDIIDLTAKK